MKQKNISELKDNVEWFLFNYLTEEEKEKLSKLGKLADKFPEYDEEFDSLESSLKKAVLIREIKKINNEA